MNTLHENKYYSVTLSPNRDGYEIINKETGVVEAAHAALPRALIVSEEYNDYLLRRDRDKLKELEEATNIVSIR